ncbi:flippase [Dyadobacter fermentans]|uniref:Polysaccharide biosynthesis protein n=1 Tax=Dyadobacter fermentans (strain ATCC 700827 / DSM 18053 / CIP 107007 / KCTC 52180 / NS114) TaxID=471854 RepID=C6VVZ2_DYAFD|nr:flippase [Dyadobacter fermentans]ACT91448.1 polysaccharide biosynthesis protein [Dyadobacter fermentans DSM 18053]
MEGKKDYWLKSGFINIVQNFSGVFFGFAGFYLLVRLLTKHDFGVWTLFISTTTILEAIRSGLLQNALIKYISSSDAREHPAIITASFAINGIVQVVCIAAILVFSPWLSRLWDAPQLVEMMYWYIAIYLLSGLQAQFNGIEQANLRFNGIFVTTLIRQGVFFTFVLVCYFFSLSVELIFLVWVQIASALAGMLIAYSHARGHLALSAKISREWMAKLFGYGKYAFGTLISSLLSGTIDQMMLGAMLSPAASGAFNIAVRITNLIDIPGNAVATIVFPQSAKRMESEGPAAIKYLYEKSVGTTLALVVPVVIFLYLFSGIVITLIAGEKYADSIPLLQITLLYCLLIPFGRQFGTILDSIGKTRMTFFVVIGTATLNLCLNYFFIREWGVVGAAYATLCSNIVGFAVAQVILRREIGVSVLNTFVYMYKFYPEFLDRYLRPMLKARS